MRPWFWANFRFLRKWQTRPRSYFSSGDYFCPFVLHWFWKLFYRFPQSSFSPRSIVSRRRSPLLLKTHFWLAWIRTEFYNFEQNVFVPVVIGLISVEPACKDKALFFELSEKVHSCCWSIGTEWYFYLKFSAGGWSKLLRFSHCLRRSLSWGLFCQRSSWPALL